MLRTRKTIQSAFSIIIVLSLAFPWTQPEIASAQAHDGIRRQLNIQTGRVSFIGPESGPVLSASTVLGTFLQPQDPAMALAQRFGSEFGLLNPARELSEIKTSRPEDGRVIVRYQQEYQGIPVLGGELIVNTNEDGDLYSMNGEVSPNLTLQISSPQGTQPEIDSAQATQTALQTLAKYYQKTPADFVASKPELWIFDESLLQPSTRPVELVWRMEVTARELGMPVRELVLVNAERGNLSLHFNQIDNAWATSSMNNGLLALDTTNCSVHSESSSEFKLFNPYTWYNCSQTGYGIGAGDFNNDGKKDVALSAYGVGFQSTLLIFLQDNNGNLKQPVSYPAGNRSEYLAVGDLDNDGRDDVVIADVSDSTISVYLQNVEGMLANRITYSTLSPDGIAVGDINNDGLDDVVASS